MTIYRPDRRDEPCRCCYPVIRPEIPIVPPTSRAFADYYAIAPSDNPNPIPAGTAIAFPRGSSSDFASISRIGESSFNLSEAGAYLVMFQVSVEDSAQLQLSINARPLAYTVAGTDSDSSQITGMAIVTTVREDAELRVVNAVNSGSSLIVTENAGGDLPSSSHLIIVKLA